MCKCFMLKHTDPQDCKFLQGLWGFALPVWSVYVCPALCHSVQKALKILQPAILEEFLGAVEGFGAFCTGSRLQDLLVVSESVRNQWEV